MVVKPDLILPTGRDQQGLGAGRTGWGVKFVAGYERGRLELLGHVAYKRNRIGEREDLTHVSAALRWAATEKLKLVGDLARRNAARARPQRGRRSRAEDGRQARF